jgi:polyketide biosynthesis acyl carrier protein
VTPTEIDRVVRDVIIAILPDLDRSTIRGESNLKDLGADSVERIEIVLQLKRRLAVNDDLERFSKLHTVDALVRFLAEQVRP